MNLKENESTEKAYRKLRQCGIRPSLQRVAIMQYLQTHFTHPTVEDVYRGLRDEIPTLSLTTVYNTLRMFSEQKAALMLTINDHHVCYDGVTAPHAHFFCKQCGMVIDLAGDDTPADAFPMEREGCLLEEVQLYYKGICNDCRNNHIV